MPGVGTPHSPARRISSASHSELTLRSPGAASAESRRMINGTTPALPTASNDQVSWLAPRGQALERAFFEMAAVQSDEEGVELAGERRGGAGMIVHRCRSRSSASAISRKRTF